jgi:SAM-dependent methyltransferase
MNADYRQEFDPIAISTLGSDYLATSWTTREEADRMIGFMELGPGRHLLDVGAGAGWPGLYLAKTSGCDVTLIDPSADAIARTRRRAGEDKPAGTWAADIGDGADLPYDNDSFDAISHSDVLCCLAAKETTLAECARVARPRARMAFSVIRPASGLDAEDHQRALANGPPLMDLDDDYPSMMERTGWRIIEHSDVTQGFLAATERQLRSGDGREDKWNNRIAALSDGLLKRELFVATPARDDA